MRTTRPLTIAEIEAAKPKPKSYYLFDGGGLFLDVMPTGSKVWRMKYRLDGKEARITFRPYPEMGLKAARKKREETRQLVAAGIDPRGERKRLEAEKLAEEQRKAHTFENIAREWFEKQAYSMSSGYLSKVQAQIERYAIPAFGKKNIDDLVRGDVLEVARLIEKSGAIESAHRFIQRVGQILRYGLNAGYNRYDVTSGLQSAIARPTEGHRAFITNKVRIAQLLRAIDAYGGYPQTRAALSLAPLLILRPGELVRSEWQEIDWQASELHIPAEKMKMRRKHIVPLCSQAIFILRELQLVTGNGQFLFPSPRGVRKHISIESLTVAARAMGFTREELHIHGLRAMASTILNERGYNRDWIERQLAHGEKDKIRAAYNYAEYLSERHRMMQDWADYLDELKAQA